jgi:hypothetical protein
LYGAIYFTIFNKKIIKILKESNQMRHRSSGFSYLSAPQNITWWIALILAVLGIIFHFLKAPFSQFSFWLVAVSAVLLLIATRIKGL